jgi:predicted permease
MSSAWQDVRYALRGLRKRPGFTAAAVTTLALGIGVPTGIFTVADRALVRELPVEQPDRLVHIVTDRGAGRINYNFSYPRYLAHRELTNVFSGALAHSPLPLAWRGGAGTQRLSGAGVTAAYFDVLGVRLPLGRGFVPEDEATAAPVTVLSHASWTRRFGASATVLGETVVLNGRTFTVVGVAPEGFHGIAVGRPTDLWIPVTSAAELTGAAAMLEDGQASWLSVFARLAPGVERAQAAAAVAVLTRQLQAAGRMPETERSLLLDGGRGLTSLVRDVSAPLRLLSGVVALVLLIACANVANLLLARATARRRELAVRASLGAGRGRLLRQLMTENVVLGLLGGAAGLVAALWVSELLLAFRPPTGVALRIEGGLDGRMLAIAGTATLLTTLLFGLAPAGWGVRHELLGSLKASGGAGGGRFGLRGALVVGQIALSLMLVVGAGLLARSLANLQAVDVGFEPRGVLLARLDLESAGYESDRGRVFYRDLLARLEATPGVKAASLARTVAPHPWGSNVAGVALEGYEAAPDEEVRFDLNFVGPRYFETLGVALRAGRSFTERDRADAAQVAIINETMARRYWPAGDAVGRRIYFGEDSTAPAVEVVGIAADGKYRDLREAPQANAYLPLLQTYMPDAAVLLRVSGSPERFVPLLRAAVREIDPELPLFDVRTLEEHVALARSQERMAASLVGLFGALALVLAVVGVYGVMSFFVGQRRQEIGIRLALGARWRDVIAMVLGRGSRPVLLGVVLGLVGALALGRAARGLLFEVSPQDPLTYLSAAFVLVAAALAAAYLPARRAARVDPMEALRYE